MFGLGKQKPVAEHESRGEIERVYHEIKQTLRVTGVNLNFRTWAGHGDFLPLVWDAFRPNAETRAFEAAADQVRAEAAATAEALGKLDVRSPAPLGESQAFHVRGALDLYHYVNPKLLVLTSAVKMALEGEAIGREPPHSPERIAPGSPAKMHAMEMESDSPDERIKHLYDDIQKTLSLPSVNSDYRTLALWPDYLEAAWHRLKPVVQSRGHREAADRLQESSRAAARQLPYPLPLDHQAVKDAGADVEEVVEVTESFERLLPGLILNIALLQLDWRQGADLSDSPFPAALRRSNLEVPHGLA